MKNTQVTLRCEICGEEFRRKRSHVSKNNYCSQECAGKGKKEVAYQRMCSIVGGEFKGWLKTEYTDNNRPIRDISRELYGTDKCSSSVLYWLIKFGIAPRDRSEAVRLQWVDNDERRKKAADGLRTRITPEVRSRVHRTMLTDEYKEKQRISKTGERNGMYGVFGENHPQWNPERTHEQRVMERKTRFDKPWRMAVFARDGFTCQLCGDKTGGNLNAHHLDSYHENKDKRYSVVNGVTLCNSCHTEYHRLYGWNDATRQKFEAFVASKGKQTA